MDTSPEKQTNVSETLSAEKTRQDCSNRGEKQGDTAQQAPTSLPWAHSLPSAQTVMVSPLSRTEGSRALPPEGSDREAKVQKLAALEKEVQRLRRLLDLEITKTTQGTMTAADSCTEKLKELSACSEGRDVGCQTDVAEVSKVIVLKPFSISVFTQTQLLLLHLPKVYLKKLKENIWGYRKWLQGPCSHCSTVRKPIQTEFRCLLPLFCVRALHHPAARPGLCWSRVRELYVHQTSSLIRTKPGRRRLKLKAG